MPLTASFSIRRRFHFTFCFTLPSAAICFSPMHHHCCTLLCDVCVTAVSKGCLALLIHPLVFLLILLQIGRNTFLKLSSGNSYTLQFFRVIHQIIGQGRITCKQVLE